jgi:hypothetical protein
MHRHFFGCAFLLPNFRPDAVELGLEEDIPFLLLLEGLPEVLQSLVHPLHIGETPLPAIQEILLAGDDPAHFELGLPEDLLGLLSLIVLGDQLGGQDVLLLLESFDLLVHGVDEEVLLLLDLLEVGHVLLGCEGLGSGDGDVAFELDVVRFDIVVVPHQVLQLLLGLRHFVLQRRCLLLLVVVALVDLRQLLLRLDPQLLDDVVIVVGFLVGHLVFGQLLLRPVQTHTCVLFLLLDLPTLRHDLLQFQLQPVFGFDQLLFDDFLIVRHQGVGSCQELEVLLLASAWLHAVTQLIRLYLRTTI